MQLILFIGIQATGKSSFYRAHFSETHLRLNLDMLKTRHRMDILFHACLESKTPVLIDNTNLTPGERQSHIMAARAAHYQIVGYYFASNVSLALQRNSSRENKTRLPDAAILGSKKKLVPPSLNEGFDKLYFVQMHGDFSFTTNPWNHEI